MELARPSARLVKHEIFESDLGTPAQSSAVHFMAYSCARHMALCACRGCSSAYHFFPFL